MKILTVIPVAKGVFRENLTYFTSKDIRAGALVGVPVRKKIVPAIVVSSREIKTAKTAVKKSEFALKPIKSVKAESFFLPEFIEACEKISDYFISPIGAAVREFVPKNILESPPLAEETAGTETSGGERCEVKIFQAPEKERLQFYKSAVREEFARKKSVFFCLPTIASANKISQELQKGIEKYTVILHGKMTKKKMAEEWKRALEEKHPVLIISTKSFFSLPRKDIGALILENENSPFYKSQTRPYIDARKAAEIMARTFKIRLILGDSVVRTETFFNIGKESVSRILSESEQIISQMGEKDSGKEQKNKVFSVIGGELRQKLELTRKKGGNSILFINRRGHSPTTVCNDCAKTILCGKCETPLVLHKERSKSKNTKFICHKCLEETSAPERCPHCKGWNLKTLGMGTQKITEEAEEMFPEAKVFRMDGDTVKTQKQGSEMVKKFYETPGAILVGTEIIFSYLNRPIDLAAAISVDGLFTLPDFRINEKIFHILLQLRSLAKKTFLIQTRLPDGKNHPLFSNAIKGNISGFYKEEIEMRKQFQYPPFKLLIKITKESKNEAALRNDAQELEEKLKKWNPVSYPAFIPKVKNLYSRHILIRTEPENWPDGNSELRQILSSLAPAWKINIDPENLL